MCCPTQFGGYQFLLEHPTNAAMQLLRLGSHPSDTSTSNDQRNRHEYIYVNDQHHPLFQATSCCSNHVWNGTGYNAAGTYTFTTQNTAGCDSVATLILTVTPVSTSTTNVTRCSNQLPYVWNGTSYGAAGTYTFTTQNAAGCDSVATLVLTIANTSSSTTNVPNARTSCYVWNGTSYNAAGTLYLYHAECSRLRLRRHAHPDGCRRGYLHDDRCALFEPAALCMEWYQLQRCRYLYVYNSKYCWL